MTPDERVRLIAQRRLLAQQVREVTAEIASLRARGLTPSDALRGRSAAIQATLAEIATQLRASGEEVDFRRKGAAVFAVAWTAHRLVRLGEGTAEEVATALGILDKVEPNWRTDREADAVVAAARAPKPKDVLDDVRDWVETRRAAFAPQDLADALNIPRNVVQVCIARLVRDAIVTHATRGLYVRSRTLGKPLDEGQEAV